MNNVLVQSPTSPTISSEFQFQIKYNPISPQELQLCFNLIKQHLSCFYETSIDYPWNEQEKKSDLKANWGRYLYVYQQETLAGFLYFRFDKEESLSGWIAVMYVYELLILPDFQKKGLGKELMIKAEWIAQHMKMEKMMLTVFRSNSNALEFYRVLGYSMDEISPLDRDYIILSKSLK